MKDAAAAALKRKGWNVLVSDLYEMKYNPVLSRADIKGKAKDPKQFKYSPETFEAWKEGRLTKDIVEEQKKIEKADLIIFQFPLYWFGMPAIMKGWVERTFCMGFAYSFQTMYSNAAPFKDKKAILSFTTGSSEAMYSPKGINGDINVMLWPLQNGILNFCGFQVLEPQITYSVARLPQEARTGMLKSWEKRLETVWDEKTIKFLPVQDFEGMANGFQMKKDVEEARSENKYGPTVGQNMGKPLPPDSQLKAEGTRL
ncbi:NAD(P)H dehydrogenase [quinone] 1-like isoform X2 [Pseudophryne corroboree]|uniref:NAD(P)H dehydrogenase [quinone] 1-like isoform X2 n=1 Tax=Pseudophryne corroboree TaxID=495146 RepID=UPI003081309F